MSIGLLAFIFGGGGVIILIEQSEQMGWLAAAGAVGVLFGIVLGIVVRKFGLSYG